MTEKVQIFPAQLAGLSVTYVRIGESRKKYLIVQGEGNEPYALVQMREDFPE